MEIFSTIELPYYRNNRIFHPDGSFLSFVNDKKINYYLKNNLAELINETEDARDIKLNFVPRGSNVLTEFEQLPRKNICVVTGKDYDLSRHHVVPEMYRKHLPLEYKSSNSHDVVLLHIKEHHKYENRYAYKFMNELSREFGTMTHHEYNLEHSKFLYPTRLAHIILVGEVNGNIPDDILLERMIEFQELTGKEATQENLEYYNSLYNDGKQQMLFGEYFMKYVTDIDDFCRRWRQHFLDTMNPRFMPEKWSVNGIGIKKII